MKKKLLTVALALSTSFSLYAQFEKELYTCDEETFNLLENLSDSQLGKGSIYLFTTTHQDLAWLNHIDACIADRDTLWLTPFLKRLQEDPTFKMDIEQTSIVMEYLHRHPNTKPLFDKYIKEGRICIGGTFIQPYEEMYSGESLARQFYLGARWLKKTFDGYKTLSYFNVDVPGRTLQMPQIMQKAGVDNLVISRHERGLFYWKAPDGSKVRAYTPGHYIYFYNVMGKTDTAAVRELGKEAVLWYTKYNNIKNTQTVMPAMLNYELSWDQKPVENTPQFISKWNSVRYIRKEGEKKWVKVNLPKFEYATADNFFNTLDKSTSLLPEIQGERPNVWLYIHGPSHERAITASRKGDIMLPAAEMMSSYQAMVSGSFTAYPVEAINAAWKAKIYPDHGWGGNGGVMTDNEFHRKYEYALSEAEKVIERQSTLLASSVKVNEEKGRPIIVFNNLSYNRTAPVCMDIRLDEGFANQLAIQDAKGINIPIQLSDVSYYPNKSIEKATVHFIANNVPSMGLQTYYLNPSNQMTPLSPAQNTKVIENTYYKIELVDGGIKQIFDKELNAPLLNTNKFLGGEVITMRSIGNGAGEFDAVQQPDMDGFDKTSAHAISWEIKEDGPVYTTYKMRTPIRNVVIEQTLRVYHQTKQIDMDVDLLNWDGVLYREYRLMWPLALDKADVSYEVPYGALTVGKDEMPGAAGERYYVKNKEQRPRGIGNWISAANDKVAVTLTSSVAVADYIDPTDQPADYTILQPVLLASRHSCHGLGNPFFQPGDHSYRFSLTSHSSGSRAREEQGVSANVPLLTVFNPVQNVNASLPETVSFISIKNPNVKVTALKKCEDDNSFIIRLYNTSADKQKVDINIYGKQPATIIHTNLIEEEVNPVEYIQLGKYAIETYKLKL
jgi:alpha-mannosidase